jgi:GTPase SAR1 family protein
MISRKVILTGSFGVGKTSLFTQFIYNKFDDKYLTTIGVKVNKKSLDIDGEEWYYIRI